MILGLVKKYKHTNWALLDQAMVSGVNFLTGILIARFLGLEEFGRFTLVWMVVLFINSIQMAMISAPMISIGPKQSDADKGSYYQAVVIQQVIFSLLTIALVFIGIEFASEIKPEWQLKGAALPLAVAAFFFQNQDFIRRYFFSLQRASDAFWNDAISYLGQLVVLLVTFTAINISTNDVLYIIGGTSALAVGFGFLKIDRGLPSVKALLVVSKRHWGFAKWSTLTALLQWFSGNLVFIITGSVLGPAAVGVLKAAQNIMAISHVLFQAMENFVPAKASDIYSKQGADALNIYRNKVLLVGGGVTAMLAIVISLFATELLSLVYGEKYAEFSYVLQWFSLIYVFMFIGFPYRAVLRAMEDTKSIFYSQIVSALFVICFGSYLVESFHLLGSLWSLLGAYSIVVFYLMASVFNKYRFINKKASCE